MPFINDLGEWNKEDVKPSQTKLDNGFEALEKPPASLFNWFFNKTYLAIKDLINNAIHKDQKGVPSGVASLGADGKVPAAQLNVQAPADASTTVKGIVMLEDTASTSTTKAATSNAVKKVQDAIPALNNTTTSTSTTQAATANAVKLAKDAADAAATAASNAQSTANTANTTANNAIPSTQKGAASGIAPLDANSKVNASYLTDASTAAKGVVQLNDTVTSTSTTLAATANAVKIAYDAANGSKVANSIAVTDAANYYTGADVEAILQEVGQTLGASRTTLITTANNIFSL